ncbi:MAG: serine/threonine protein kinase, partial [Duncaniella sp.]|nr:serine/threonine protein kinase [Duncaniella sp.]
MIDNDTSILSFPAGGGDTVSTKELESHGVNRLFLLVRNGKKFLLKGLKAPYSGIPQYEAMLRKEYDLGMALDHPNIVRILAFESSETLGSGILMEWIDGSTLSEFLKSGATMDERIRIAIELADALAYIHSKGVSHRDLKPDNIVITSGAHSVRLIDFGLGDADDHTLMKISTATERYGAPEQLSGLSSDSKSDVYSFGRILETLKLPVAFRPIRKSCLLTLPASRPSMAQVASRLRHAQQRRRLLPIVIVITAIVTAIASAIVILTLRTADKTATAPPPSLVTEITVENDKPDTTGTVIGKPVQPAGKPAESADRAAASTNKPAVSADKSAAHGDIAKSLLGENCRRADSLTTEFAPLLLSASTFEARGKLLD